MLAVPGCWLSAPLFPLRYLKLRIPGWARDQAVPSDLYKFQDTEKEPVALKVNGSNAPVELNQGYVSVQRFWKKGDVIELRLPMPVRRVVANEKVTDDAGTVAFRDLEGLMSGVAFEETVTVSSVELMRSIPARTGAEYQPVSSGRLS